MTTKHYHVLGGLSGGYMPDSNSWYKSIKQARESMKELVTMSRIFGERFTGSMKKCYFVSTNNNYYFEVTECFEKECLTEEFKDNGSDGI